MRLSKGGDETVGPVSVGDFVWVDVNEKGIQDPDEEGIAAVTLEMVGPDSNQVTSVNGKLAEDATIKEAETVAEDNSLDFGFIKAEDPEGSSFN